MIITAITAKKTVSLHIREEKYWPVIKPKEKKMRKSIQCFMVSEQAKRKKNRNQFFWLVKKNIDYNPCTCQSGTFFYFIFSTLLSSLSFGFYW